MVVGSGPGGLQTSYCLTRLGVRHAVISRDEGPGGMFRRFPVFQRLLSWTKPDAPAVPGTREYEWYDHNSLLGDEPGHQATVVPQMDRTFFVPSRPEMEAGLAAFAEQAGVQVRYGCTWEATRRDDEGFTIVTSDGDYRCRAAVFALGVTEPWKSDIPGIEAVPHYAETRPARDYQGKRVFVIGKRNSGFELADGLEPWARQVILGSPRPVSTSVLAFSTVRARYMQPLEDYQLGGGTLALDAAIERIERTGDGFVVHAQGTTRPGAVEIEADDVIAATGFSTPLRDLPEIGVATVSQGRIPALTNFWESATVPRLYFAGNASQGAAGLRKHGLGSSSAAVYGFRYNARVLARHLCGSCFDIRANRPPVDPAALVPYLLGELTHAPELWAQKSYLARVVAVEEGLLRDDGILPLQHFVDEGAEGVAVAVEQNPAGEIFPAVYLRTGGRLEERLLPPENVNDFEGEAYRAELAAVVAPLLK